MGCGLDAACVRRVSSFGPVIVRVGRGLPVDFSSTKETRIKKKAPRQLVVFPLLHHGSGSSSPELCRNGDFGNRIQIQVYGEGEEDEGFSFGDSGHGKSRSSTAAAAAGASAPGARCGELAGGRERDGRGLR